MGVVLCLFFATEAGLFGIAACLYIYVWRPFSASFLLCMFYCVVTEIFPVDLGAIAISVTFSGLFFLTSRRSSMVRSGEVPALTT
jgi:hypothetical protein